ncbi:High-affinity zinc uptake system membrane protein znuB [Moraxella caviae]|uniref:metal ABC transporter permease n=1 Tax=Moraxella caviae TaxID=34060 RepID=UPI00101B3FFA|nr:High-affinity zinc uptake system membrane protein znuB [Moraxella caviae]
MTDWLPIIAPAWIAGSLLALLSAPLGCLVLWRRMAFFADTLAHGTLLGVAIAAALSLPADMGVGVVSALVVLILMALKDSRLPNDATLAVMTAVLLCLGLLTLTQLTQQQANVLGYLFGSLLDLDWADLPRLAVLIALVWRFGVDWACASAAATFEALRHRSVKPKTQQLFSWGFWRILRRCLTSGGHCSSAVFLILPALTARLFRTHHRMVILPVCANVAVTLGVWAACGWIFKQGLPSWTLACGFFITFGVQNCAVGDDF